MSCETVEAMHRTFLQEIREKRAALQEELRTLESVERYHVLQLGEHEGGDLVKATPPGNGVSEGILPRHLAKSLRTAKKHDAAAIVLKHLGRPAKIGQIIDVLWENGYGKNLKRRILHNTLYTGMSRRTDIFRKLNDGLWNLRAEPEDEEDQTDNE